MAHKSQRSAKLTKVALKDLLWDNRYSFSFPVNSPRLEESVRKNGVIQPVWVTPENGKFYLISGFRRILAASAFGINDVSALVYEDFDPFELFRLHLEENGVARDFNPVEQSLIVSAATRKFGKKADEVIDVLFPLLRLAASKKIFNTLIDLDGFGPSAWRLIAKVSMPLGQTQNLVRFDDVQRESLCQWLIGKKLGVNRTNQMIEMVSEICAIDKTTANAVMSEAEEGISGKIEEPLRNSLLFDAISKRRNPALASMSAQFESALKQLRLHRAIVVRPPKNFEGRHVEFMIKAENASDAISSAQSLVNADKSKIEKLFDWI